MPDSMRALLSRPLRLENLRIVEPEGRTVIKNRIVGFSSEDPRARPFNLLRTSFTRSMETSDRLIALTSAAPAAGKSFLSLNLAASLSRVTTNPVFLVDLDLRRASLAAELGLDIELGVEAFLSGEVNSLEEIGLRIEGTQLGLFPAKRTTGATAELMAGKMFDQMIEIFRNESEASFVIFDLPPVFANDDTMIILEKLDGYVMVVDSGRTTRRQIEDVTAMLQPTPCVGSILNRYRGGLGDPYGYGYYGDNYSKYYK